MQQLAAAVGCQPTMAPATKDYREARCTADGTEFVLVDFDTPEIAHAWVDYAVMYGGVFLAGDRWALSGKSKQYMENLQIKLGGEIREQPDHGPGT